MSNPFVTLCQNAHPSEFAVPADPSAPHYQCIDDRLADIGNLGQRSAHFHRGNMKYLGIRCCYPCRR
jgi:hypothetical protein